MVSPIDPRSAGAARVDDSAGEGLTFDSLCTGHRNVLLVEGQDDLHVVLHLYKKAEGKVPNFCIRAMGNDSQLLAEIVPAILSSDRDIIGIIIDADDDPGARWKEVVNKVEEAVKKISESSIAIPQKGRENGVIVAGKPDDDESRSPRVGIWIMPDNQTSGELEDFVVPMIPPDTPALPLAKDYIGRVLTLNDDKGRLQEGKRLCGEIHAWLATRERPRHLGAAIQADYLNTDGESCRSFMAWLRRLFGEPPP